MMGGLPNEEEAIFFLVVGMPPEVVSAVPCVFGDTRHSHKEISDHV